MLGAGNCFEHCWFSFELQSEKTPASIAATSTQTMVFRAAGACLAVEAPASAACVTSVVVVRGSAGSSRSEAWMDCAPPSEVIGSRSSPVQLSVLASIWNPLIQSSSGWHPEARVDQPEGDSFVCPFLH